jgi:hypothetical protein
MHTLIAVPRNACVIRYRLDHRLGWLRFVAATADSYLYAGVIFLVVSAAFGRGGADRYFLIVLGIIGLRWTLSCLATADTMAPLTMLMAREAPAPKLHALVYVVAPPTFVFLGSLVGFVIVTQLFGSGENSIAGLIWFPLLFVFHLSLNVAAVLAVGEAFRRGWLTSTAPVLIAATLVWFVSPVMYRFDDLDSVGVALLTTWSPGSHLIAAYHNGFWFGQSPSLEVLPAAAAGAALVAFALLLLPLRRSDRGSVADIPQVAGPLTLVVDPESMLGAEAERNAVAAGWSVHHPLRGTPRGMTGQDWTRLVHALRHPRQGGGSHDFERRIEAATSIGDLFRRAMTLYPEAVADRLACALALDRVPDRALLLVRLFDALPRDQVTERWNWLAGRCSDAGRIAVVSNRLLLPGDTAPGAFVLLRPGAPTAAGAIADGLPAAYAAYLEAASRGSAAPGQSVKSS